MRSLRTAFVVLSAALLVGCHESPLTSPAVPAPNGDLLGGLLGGLVPCQPTPFDSVTQVIGPAGGVIAVGPHTFTVPAGALDRDVAITATIVGGNVDAVHFEPEGLQFSAPATLRLSYAQCSPLAHLVPKHVAYTSDLLAILEVVPSLDDLGSATIAGSIRHFSDYAVAW